MRPECGVSQVGVDFCEVRIKDAAQSFVAEPGHVDVFAVGSLPLAFDEHGRIGRQVIRIVEVADERELRAERCRRGVCDEGATGASAVVKKPLPPRPPMIWLYNAGGVSDWNVTDAQCVPNRPPPRCKKRCSTSDWGRSGLPMPKGSKHVLIMATAA